MNSKAHPDHNHGEHLINVRVVTTAGSYPAHGHERVQIAEPIAAILERAAQALGILDTKEWVARIGGDEVNAQQSYAQLHLHGEAKIDYGRRESGGG